jgi:hypothetical protein
MSEEYVANITSKPTTRRSAAASVASAAVQPPTPPSVPTEPSVLEREYVRMTEAEKIAAEEVSVAPTLSPLTHILSASQTHVSEADSPAPSDGSWSPLRGLLTVLVPVLFVGAGIVWYVMSSSRKRAAILAQASKRSETEEADLEISQLRAVYAQQAALTNSVPAASSGQGESN